MCAPFCWQNLTNLIFTSFWSWCSHIPTPSTTSHKISKSASGERALTRRLGIVVSPVDSWLVPVPSGTQQSAVVVQRRKMEIRVSGFSYFLTCSTWPTPCFSGFLFCPDFSLINNSRPSFLLTKQGTNCSVVSWELFCNLLELQRDFLDLQRDLYFISHQFTVMFRRILLSVTWVVVVKYRRSEHCFIGYCYLCI